MDVSQTLEKLLPAFRQYYTINKDAPVQPFLAEAEFRSHNEQYFLVRSAHIADIDSNEFIYFATESSINNEKLQTLTMQAWERGLAKVKPYNGHKNSDITLIIIADKCDPASFEGSPQKIVKKIKHYKSYNFSLHGWSNFKLALVELENQNIYFNRFGKDYRKLFEKNIFKNSLGGKEK